MTSAMGPVMACLPDDVLGAARHGGISRRALLDLGHSPSQISWWLASGLLSRHTRGHYRLGEHAVDPLGRLDAALGRSGLGARIGGSWACGLYELEGFDLSGHDHVVIDPRRRVRGAPFTVVRSRLAPVDQAVVRGLPTVTAARALLGAATDATAKAVRVAFDDARRRRLITLDELAGRAVALGNVRGAPRMRRIIDSGLLRFESEGERWVSRYLWQPGDPVPEAQVPVRCAGRIYRLDFAFLEARLCLEYDGRKDHLRDADRFRDADRDLALSAVEIETLRITAEMLRHPARTRGMILAVRKRRIARGYPPIVPSAAW